MFLVFVSLWASFPLIFQLVGIIFPKWAFRLISQQTDWAVKWWNRKNLRVICCNAGVGTDGPMKGRVRAKQKYEVQTFHYYVHVWFHQLLWWLRLFWKDFLNNLPETPMWEEMMLESSGVLCTRVTTLHRSFNWKAWMQLLGCGNSFSRSSVFWGCSEGHRKFVRTVAVHPSIYRPRSDFIHHTSWVQPFKVKNL